MSKIKQVFDECFLFVVEFFLFHRMVSPISMVLTVNVLYDLTEELATLILVAGRANPSLYSHSPSSMRTLVSTFKLRSAELLLTYLQGPTRGAPVFQI